MDQTTQLFVDFQRGLALNGILSDPALEHQVCGDLSAAFQGILAKYGCNNNQPAESIVQEKARASAVRRSETQAATAPPAAPPPPARAQLTEAELKSLYDIEMMLCRKLMQHGHSQRELFLSYDADRSGLMTPQEFAAAAGAVGIRLNNNELTLLVRKYDADHNGGIDYNEFLRIFNSKSVAATTNSIAYSATMASPERAREMNNSDYRPPASAWSTRSDESKTKSLAIMIRRKLKQKFHNVTALFLQLDAFSPETQGEVHIADVAAGLKYWFGIEPTPDELRYCFGPYLTAASESNFTVSEEGILDVNGIGRFLSGDHPLLG